MKAAILVGEQVLVESIGAVAQLVIELKATGVALLIGWAVEYFSTALKKPRLRPLKLPYARAFVSPAGRSRRRRGGEALFK